MTNAKTTTVASKPNEQWFEETFLWRIKVRLQFTGWLQYMPNLLAVLIMLLLSGIGWWIGVWPWLLAGAPAALAAILVANLAFDLATVKFGIHPAEPLPARKSELDAFDLMRSRISCRSFQQRNLTADHRAELMKHVREYSRPENTIGDHPIRVEYVAAPLTVWPVVGAQEFLVAIAPKAYHRLAVVDIGRSLQKVVFRATRMGLATCWIGPGLIRKASLHTWQTVLTPRATM
ncbi:MAG: hypothetical protein JRE71_18635 [Deltaproteobacteria bacterium]|nr:hypothetical protein [Deltaproteobacteria bacterium]